MIDDFETREGGIDYLSAIKSKLTDDLSANYEFLITFYSQRKKFVDENWGRVIGILKSGKGIDKNQELIERLNHYINQQYAFLYWLREGYFAEQAQKLDNLRAGIKMDDKSLFSYREESELNELNQRTIELERLIEKSMVKEE